MGSQVTRQAFEKVILAANSKYQKGMRVQVESGKFLGSFGRFLLQSLGKVRVVWMG